MVPGPIGVPPDMRIDDIPVTTIDGDETTLAPYADDLKLIVNVASRCGLSPQYAALETLQRTYADRGFTVLGFPSDQFKQELDTDDAVAEYCSATWGVTFPMFARVAVNGADRHPLYAALTETPDPAGEAGDVQWNFEKFLVTPAGEVHRFRPRTEPDAPEVVARIEAELPVSA